MDEKFCQKCDEPAINYVTPCPLQCSSPKCKAYTPPPKIDVYETPIIWVLGGPGCGKGTQCARIAKKYGFSHLSTGDLLREEVSRGTDRARCIQDIMTRGGLVPTEIVLDLLKKSMLENKQNSNGFLVDGYPREASQTVAFERDVAPVTAILYFEVSRETLLKRLRGRALSGARLDDNEQTFMLRLDSFFAHKDRILEQHPDKLKRVNAEGPIEAIYQELVKILDPIIEHCRVTAARNKERLAEQKAKELQEIKKK